VPKPLRIVRTLALVLLGVVAIGALLVGALRFVSDEPAPEPVAASPPPPPVQQAQRPSPITELPADATDEPEEEPEPEPPPPEPAAQPKPTTTRPPEIVPVRIVTNPPGAFVVVDGASSLSCQTPCSVELPPGRHTLSATRDGFRRTLRIFQTPADSELFLNLDRSAGTVVVRSDPAGAAITVDGQQRPEKTPAMLTLAAGQHTLEIAGNGNRESVQVNVRDSGLTNVSVSLR
jgi:outer membrane biosynthesis protein TonB